MKIFILIFSLFTLSFPLVSNSILENNYNILKKNIINILKKDLIEKDNYSYLGHGSIFPLKKECNDALEKLIAEFENDCKIFKEKVNITESDNNNNNNNNNFLTDEECKKFNSSNCQKHLDVKFIEILECKDANKSIVMSLEYMFKLSLRTYKYQCVRDENNDYCGFNDPELVEQYENKELPEEELKKIENRILMESCKSKKCTDKYLEYLNDMKSSTENITKIFSKEYPENEDDSVNINLNELFYGFNYTETYSILSSKSCTSQHANATSDASIVIFSYYSLIIFIFSVFTLLLIF